MDEAKGKVSAGYHRRGSRLGRLVQLEAKILVFPDRSQQR